MSLTEDCRCSKDERGHSERDEEAVDTWGICVSKNFDEQYASSLRKDKWIREVTGGKL